MGHEGIVCSDVARHNVSIPIDGGVRRSSRDTAHRRVEGLVGTRGIVLVLRHAEDDVGSELESRRDVVGLELGDLCLAQARKLQLEIFDGGAGVVRFGRVAEEEAVHCRDRTQVALTQLLDA